MQELDINELDGCYDFVYLPMDTSTESNVGYAFVNFSEPVDALRALSIFKQYRFSKYTHKINFFGSVSLDVHLI